MAIFSWLVSLNVLRPMYRIKVDKKVTRVCARRRKKGFKWSTYLSPYTSERNPSRSTLRLCISETKGRHLRYLALWDRRFWVSDEIMHDGEGAFAPFMTQLRKKSQGVLGVVKNCRILSWWEISSRRRDLFCLRGYVNIYWGQHGNGTEIIWMDLGERIVYLLWATGGRTV